MFSLLFTAQAERQPFLRVHSGLSSIFSITIALHAGKYRDFWTGNLPLPTSQIFIISLEPLRPSTKISRLSCSLVVTTSKKCCGRSKTSSVVESQGYFVSEAPFSQLYKQQTKFANKVDRLTLFFEKVDSQLPSRLMMLIRQPLKMKNGSKLTKNPT